MGNEDNESQFSAYPPNQLMIWDDAKKGKAGLIMMKNRISSFTLTQNMLAVFTSNILCLFEIHSLKYMMKITNLNLNDKLYSICQDTVAYTTIQKKSTVNIIICTYTVINIFIVKFIQHKLEYKLNKKIASLFQEIQAIQLSNSAELLFVGSLLGNKIHIYDIADDSLKFCVFTGNRIISLENIQFNTKLNYLLFVSDQIKLEIITLKNKDNSQVVCCCDEHDDNLMLGRPKRKPSLLEGIMSGFTEKPKPLNECDVISTLDIPNGMSNVLYAGFDLMRKKELVF